MNLNYLWVVLVLLFIFVYFYVVITPFSLGKTSSVGEENKSLNSFIGCTPIISHICKWVGLEND